VEGDSLPSRPDWPSSIATTRGPIYGPATTKDLIYGKGSDCRTRGAHEAAWATRSRRHGKQLAIVAGQELKSMVWNALSIHVSKNARSSRFEKDDNRDGLDWQFDLHAFVECVQY
jgi:hypothetical protein